MTRIFMFPGQGAQHRGMGADLFPRFPELAREAQDVLGYSVERLCLEDPDDQLGLTGYTQPAMYVVNAMCYRAALAEGPPPDVVIGHSLGEYNALEAAGVFSFADGLRTVAARAAAMARISGGGMSAVVGLPETTLRFLLLRAGFDGLEVANVNTGTQIVVSGPVDDLDDVGQILEDAGARMVRRLDVSGPFHSRYMRPAAQALEAVVSSATLTEPRLPVIANRTAQPYTRADAARLLVEQVDHPVLWHEIILRLLDDPTAEFVEIGDSTVLSGMIRQIRREQRSAA